jgi:hypothetical protein
MTIWASGVKAWAICDRCGIRFKYAKIVTEPGTNMRVCRRCLDPVPLGEDFRRPQGDPFPLQYPRPDVSLTSS